MTLEKSDILGCQLKKTLSCRPGFGENQLIASPGITPEIPLWFGSMQRQQICIPTAAGKQTPSRQLLGRETKGMGPLLKNQNLIGHQSHLLKGVTDKKEGDVKLGKDLFQVGNNLIFQLTVEPAQRLIHENETRAGKNGAPESDPLPLSAGEAAHTPVKKIFKVEDPDEGIGIDSPLWDRSPLPAVEEVSPHTHVGKEVRMLKNHTDPPLFRSHIQPLLRVKKEPAVQTDPPLIRGEQPGKKMHEGGFAAAGWAENPAALLIENEIGRKGKSTISFLYRDRKLHCRSLRLNLRDMDSLANRTTREMAMETRQSERAIRSPPGVLV